MFTYKKAPYKIFALGPKFCWAGPDDMEDNILDTRMKFLQWWNVVFLLSCIIAVALDPLFFYLPVINEDKKFIRLDKKLWITAIVLRSFFDIIYLCISYCNFALVL